MAETYWTKKANLFASSLSGEEVKLLNSPDSLTKYLETNLNSPIHAELVESKDITPDDVFLSLFEIEEDHSYIERIIWLTSNHKRLIYAKSTIASTSTPLLEELKSTTDPLGKVLTSMGIHFSKSQIFIGVTSAKESKELFDSPLPLFNKSYVLENRDKSSLTIKAYIREIFSSSLINTPES